MLNNLLSEPVENDDTIMQSLMNLIILIGELDNNSELLRVSIQAITDYKILRNQIKVMQNIIDSYENNYEISKE
jgi:hypothetical protein